MPDDVRESIAAALAGLARVDRALERLGRVAEAAGNATQTAEKPSDA